MKTLRLPTDAQSVRELRAGESVLLSGEIVITAGLPTHKRMMDFIARGEDLPIDLANGALIHFGGYSETKDDNYNLLYMNPTTSTRFNPYMPTIIRALNVRVCGGKGGLDAASAQAMKEAGCVYLSFLGGGCTPLSQAIREVVDVAWSDMIVHYRLVKLRVEGLGPAVVGIDAHGRNLYDEARDRAEQRMPQILADLAAARAIGKST